MTQRCPREQRARTPRGNPRSSGLGLTLLVLAVALISAPVQAMHLEGAQVQDPAGDAGPAGAPVGAGFEAYDITAIRLSDLGPETIRVEIEVVDLPRAPPHGEIGVVFGVDGDHYMAGFTVLVFGGSYYVGGFACPATPDGQVNGSVSEDCLGLPDAEIVDGAYQVDVPREFVNATHAGTVLTSPFGWSEVAQFKMDATYTDHTDPGSDVVLSSGAGSLDRSPDPDTPPASGDQADIPAPGWLATLLASGAIAAIVGRARGPLGSLRP